MVAEAQLTPRAERTRSAILEAAERVFAERGFPAARLEEVAARVGIRRASIVYYFKDKSALYDAVLAEVMRALTERMREALLAEGSLAARVEAAVSAWVDFVGGRPTFARLLLREVAGATADSPPRLLAHIQPMYELVERVMSEGRSDPLAHSAPINPAHLASAVAGTTLFFVSAMPTLVPGLGFDPLSQPQLEMHRAEVLRITRRLLGIDGELAARRLG